MSRTRRVYMTQDPSRDVNRLFDDLEKHLNQTKRLAGTTEIVGKRMAQRAKNKIGHPNPPVGPFAPWAPLAASTLAQRHAKGYTDDSRILERTGELRESIESRAAEQWAQAIVPMRPSKDPDKRGADLGQIAYWLEFGGLMLPPRPFMGPALFELRPIIVDLIERGIIQALEK